MSVSEDDGILIKPQVIPASSQNVQTPHNGIEEKKRRIDEALEHYEKTHQGIGVAAESTPTATPHYAAPAPPSVHTPKKKSLLLAHEAHHAKPAKRVAATPHEPVEPGLVMPTHVDPDAPIAAAIQAAKQREAERKAQSETEAAKPNSRYRQTASIDLDVFVSRKFILSAVVWLLAIPMAIVLYHTTSSLAVVAHSTFFDRLLLMIEYALGVYGAFGWIPLVVFYMREYKNQ